jgi:hypothetical protein
VPHLTLGQFLHGILWELSFHGGPDEQESFLQEMESIKNEVDQRAETGDSTTAWLEEMDAQRCHATLLDLGGCAACDIAQGVRNLDDDEAVEAGLRRVLRANIVIKPEFANLEARAFRTIFRNAST